MSDATEYIQKFLEELGLSEQQDGQLAETPEAFTKLIRRRFSSMTEKPPELSAMPCGSDDYREPVLISEIPFYSMCAHHLVPMFGDIDIAYVPDEKLLGFGSFQRAVEYESRKPQLQERLVNEIKDRLVDVLEPEGLLIRCRARQMCVELNHGGNSHFIAKSSIGTLSSGELRGEVLAEFRDR